MAGNANSGGRNKKPTHLHVIQGTYRRDRHGDHETPVAPAGRPTPPKPLGAEEQAEWDRMVARLEEIGALSKVDDAALYQYVLLFAEVEEIRADNARLRKNSAKLMKLAQKLQGMELVEAMNRIVELEQVIAKQTTQLRQGHMALRQWLDSLGSTPVARNRLKMPPQKPAADMKKERFFGGGGARA